MAAYPDYLHEDPSLPGRAGSYWLASTAHVPRPPLTEDISAEIVVIGAGLAGTLVAYESALAGHEVLVLERDAVLSDVTGHTTAKVTAVHGSVLAEAVAALGDRAVGRHVAANHLAIEYIAQTAAQLGVSCDMTAVDTIAYIEDPERLTTLQQTRDALLAGALEPLDVDRESLGVLSTGAFRVPRELRFHPVKFAAGVLAAAEQAGALVHERTRVVSLDERSAEVHLTTAGGAVVTAEHVVVATNYPFHDHGVLFSRLFPYRSYVLGAYLAQELPDRNYIALDESLTLRIQPAEKGDLVIASGVSHKAGEGGDERERYHELERRLRERYDVLDIPYHWSTQDNRTPDGLPFVGRSPGLQRTWIATGFSAWGMTQSAVAAQVLRVAITGGTHPVADLYDPSRFEASRTGATIARENVDVSKEFASTLLAEGPADTLEPDEGRRIRKGLHRVAAYRDTEGRLHEVSAACTHRGCGLGFNDAEKTWDCPCHGSRFDIDGRVIHGPAVRDLDAR